MKRYLIDLDGTLYRGDTAIDGAAEFIAGLQRRGISFLLLTNCPLHSPEQLQKKLESMGISVLEKQILSSGSACAEYVGERYPGKRVVVVGSESFTELIGESGAVLCRGETGFADAVAVGHTRRLDFEQLSRAAACIRNGADFIATNLDAVIPRGGGLAPHTGALAAYLETASGRSPFVVGKPFPCLLEAALKRLRCQKEDCVMVGDGIDTDFAFAGNNGIDVRIILSGVTDRETALRSGVPAGKICQTLAEIKIG